MNLIQSGTPEFSAIIPSVSLLLSCVSTLIAIVSIIITRKNWQDSNRPVVSGYIDEESGADGMTIFNLYITNTGTRPAVSIQLSAKEQDIHRLIEAQAKEPRRKQIEYIFTSESCLAILLPNETLATSFGLASTNNGEEWLKYKESIKSRITYYDLEDRKYTSHILLRTSPRNGFGGSIWQNAA